MSIVNKVGPSKLIFDYPAGIEQGLFNRYTPEQKNVIEAIVKAANDYGVKVRAQLAYMLATTYHECYDWSRKSTDGRMVQLVEKGGAVYLRSKPYYPYHGRGPSHLTWEANYKKEGARLGLDLVGNPDLMLDLSVGAPSHVYCMMNGRYTGVKLTKYITSSSTDFPNARRVINGTDQAELIAKYASKFLRCLKVEML